MNYLKIYSDFLKKFLKPDRPVRAVFDCSNGAVGPVLKEVFSDAILINDKPDGNFPAHGPDPTREGAAKELQKKVMSVKADFGAVFDADGDRVVFVDDRGRLLASAQAASLLSRNFSGPMVSDVILGNVPGKKVIESRVGTFYIKQAMKKHKAKFAAEFSGHFYFKDFFYADSAILATIYFINSVSRLKGKLSRWLDEHHCCYQKIINLPFNRSKLPEKLEVVEAKFKKEAKSISHLDVLKMKFDSPAGEWWFNIRPSNTEDLVRINVEGKDKKLVESKIKSLATLLRAD